MSQSDPNREHGADDPIFMVPKGCGLVVLERLKADNGQVELVAYMTDVSSTSDQVLVVVGAFRLCVESEVIEEEFDALEAVFLGDFEFFGKRMYPLSTEGHGTDCREELVHFSGFSSAVCFVNGRVCSCTLFLGVLMLSSGIEFCFCI